MDTNNIEPIEEGIEHSKNDDSSRDIKSPQSYVTREQRSAFASLPLQVKREVKRINKYEASRNTNQRGCYLEVINDAIDGNLTLDALYANIFNKINLGNILSTVALDAAKKIDSLDAIECAQDIVADVFCSGIVSKIDQRLDLLFNVPFVGTSFDYWGFFRQALIDLVSFIIARILVDLLKRILDILPPCDFRIETCEERNLNNPLLTTNNGYLLDGSNLNQEFDRMIVESFGTFGNMPANWTAGDAVEFTKQMFNSFTKYDLLQLMHGNIYYDTAEILSGIARGIIKTLQGTSFTQDEVRNICMDMGTFLTEDVANALIKETNQLIPCCPGGVSGYTNNKRKEYREKGYSDTQIDTMINAEQEERTNLLKQICQWFAGESQSLPMTTMHSVESDTLKNTMESGLEAIFGAIGDNYTGSRQQAIRSEVLDPLSDYNLALWSYFADDNDIDPETKKEIQASMTKTATLPSALNLFNSTVFKKTFADRFSFEPDFNRPKVLTTDGVQWSNGKQFSSINDLINTSVGRELNLFNNDRQVEIVNEIKNQVDSSFRRNAIEKIVYQSPIVDGQIVVESMNKIKFNNIDLLKAREIKFEVLVDYSRFMRKYVGGNQ